MVVVVTEVSFSAVVTKLDLRGDLFFVFVFVLQVFGVSIVFWIVGSSVVTILCVRRTLVSVRGSLVVVAVVLGVSMVLIAIIILAFGFAPVLVIEMVRSVRFGTTKLSYEKDLTARLRVVGTAPALNGMDLVWTQRKEDINGESSTFQ